MCRQQVNTNTWLKLNLSKRFDVFTWRMIGQIHTKEKSPAVFQHNLLLYWQVAPGGRNAALENLLPIVAFVQAAPCLHWGPFALWVTLQRSAARKSHRTHPPPEFCQATPKESSPFLGKRASRRKIWCYHQKCLGWCTEQQIPYSCDDDIKA